MRQPQSFSLFTCILCFLLGLAAGAATFIKLSGPSRHAHLDIIEKER